MPRAITIQFTQDQARILTGVTAEALRHWRKTIPYLASKSGKAARFSFADLVGLAITNELVKSLGIHIGTIRSGVDALFHALSEKNLGSLGQTTAFVTPKTVLLCDTGTSAVQMALKEPMIAIPLGPLLDAIQQQMLPVLPFSEQAVLPFALESIRSKA